MIVVQAQEVHTEGIQALLVRLQGPPVVRLQNAERLEPGSRDPVARLRSHSGRELGAGQVRHSPRSAGRGRHVRDVDPLRLGQFQLVPCS